MLVLSPKISGFERKLISAIVYLKDVLFRQEHFLKKKMVQK